MSTEVRTTTLPFKESIVLTELAPTAGVGLGVEYTVGGATLMLDIVDTDGKPILLDVDLNAGNDTFKFEVVGGRDGTGALRDGSIFRGGDGKDKLDFRLLGDVDLSLYGDAGNDTIRGGAGDDKIYGGANKDRLFGGKGNDLLFGGKGNDRLYGNAGNDLLEGNDGNDLLKGGGGVDKLDGGDGNDKLIGGNKNDILVGGSGNNVMEGGRGADTMTSSSLFNQDRFFYGSPKDSGNNKIGFDVISNFDTDPGESSLEDIIQVSKFGFDSTVPAGVKGLELGRSKNLVVDFLTDLGDRAGFRFILGSSTTGTLYFDRNGGNAGGIREIASFVNSDLNGFTTFDETNIEVVA
ncbi:MAG: calcium-binding protein [Prochloraceae cyanobacterium]|nr:calcium-binding protein [Prochloraceae cyanobacterium]